MRISPSESTCYSIFGHQLTKHRAWIHTVTQKLKNKPLLDIVGGVIEDYEFLWDQYYFPTATL
jgi:hypothetical protein